MLTRLTRLTNDADQRIQRWLSAVGWSSHPFAEPNAVGVPLSQAEQEVEDSSRWYSTSPVRPGSQLYQTEPGIADEEDLDYFDDLLANNHALVWGGMGTGKSATRLVLRSTNSSLGRLVVEYVNRSVQVRSPEQLADSLSGLIMRAGMKLPDSSDFSAKQILEDRGNPIASLSALVNNVRSVIKQPIIVLVDGVDVDMDGNALETIYQKIKPILTRDFLEMAGINFKMFLPLEARDRIEGLPGLRRFFDTDRLKSFSLTWNANTLLEMLRSRLNRVQCVSLDDISADSVGMPFRLEDELIRMALTADGPPRAMLRLGWHTVATHVKRTDFYENYRLTEQDFRAACTQI